MNSDIKNSPIGIFDSGLGGLTTVKMLKKLMPHEDIIYFGDTARAPYGPKSKEKIIEYASQSIKFLKSFKVKTIVAACGTVSSYIDESSELKDLYGVINPTCKAAINSSRNMKIGVMGTSATIKSSSYLKKIHSINPSVKVFQVACPLLVPIIESGKINDSKTQLLEILKNYTQELLYNNIDTLILGCTHYPIIENIISEVMGKNITIINSGAETAKKLKNILSAQNLESNKKDLGKCSFYVSGDADKFSETAKIFLNCDMKNNIYKIDPF